MPWGLEVATALERNGDWLSGVSRAPRIQGSRVLSWCVNRNQFVRKQSVRATWDTFGPRGTSKAHIPSGAPRPCPAGRGSLSAEPALE